MNRVLVEVCLDSAESAVAAEKGGADRVELCADLLEGGLTPSAGMIAAVRKAIRIGLMVMIRPRGGDFRYSALELDAMRHDVAVAKDLGADGVVLGVLTPEGAVDAEVTADLVERARPMAVTFHRAFDMTRDPFEALEMLVALGVDRILTSGQEASALEGLDLVAALVTRAAGRLSVMPGCGITARNLGKILTVSGAREVHVVATEEAESPMVHRNPRCYMGTELRAPEYRRMVTSSAALATLLAGLGR